MNPKTRRIQPDQFDRALAAARRAIGTLIGLLDDEDQAMVEKAARALEEIGPFVVGPLATALPRARSVRLRLMIIGALLHFASQARAPVARALTGVLRREKDPRVLSAAQVAFTRLVVDDLVASATQARRTPVASPSTDPGCGGPSSLAP